jgi:hypothetical protein
LVLKYYKDVLNWKKTCLVGSEPGFAGSKKRSKSARLRVADPPLAGQRRTSDGHLAAALGHRRQQRVHATKVTGLSEFSRYQGDRIGRFFARTVWLEWANFCLFSDCLLWDVYVLKITALCSPNFWATFFPRKRGVHTTNFFEKINWATVWPIFLQTDPVTLLLLLRPSFHRGDILISRPVKRSPTPSVQVGDVVLVQVWYGFFLEIQRHE